MYRNQGKDGFSDVSYPAQLAQPTFLKVGWGTAFFDMDNDGWLDIFIANGHVYPQVDSIPGGLSYREPIQLFRNRRDGTFQDVSSALAEIPTESRRGAAFGDINNDGNIDVVLVNVGALPTLLLNQGGNHNHRALFKLAGKKSNRSAIGARVTVTAGKLAQFSEVRAGGSYLSQNDPRLHFGLGAEVKMSEVEIRWPSGKVEVLRDLPADFIYTIVEGQGIESKLPCAPVASFRLQHFPKVGLCLSASCPCGWVPRVRREARQSVLRHGFHLIDRVERFRLALLLRHPTHLAIACRQQNCNNCQRENELTMEEREFFDERPEKKMATLNCPHCHQPAEYEVTWIVRTKKRQLSGRADERDRARFAKARSYMLRKDDLMACKNVRCRKRFEISGVQSVVFTE